MNCGNLKLITTNRFRSIPSSGVLSLPETIELARNGPRHIHTMLDKKIGRTYVEKVSLFIVTIMSYHSMLTFNDICTV